MPSDPGPKFSNVFMSEEGSRYVNIIFAAYDSANSGLH